MGGENPVITLSWKDSNLDYGGNTSMKREKTKYPAVFYIESKNNDRIFYIRYYRDGKRIEEKIGHQSRGMTAAKANLIRTQRIQGKAPSNQEKRDKQENEKREKDSIWTFNRLWAEYLSTHETKSIEICKSRFAKHIEPVFGDKEPKDVVQLDITRFKRDLKNRELKPGSVNKVLELLRRVTNFGTNNRLVTDLEYRVKLDKIDDERTEYLTDDQFQNLWESLKIDENLDAANFMKLVLFTGMRRGELFKLQKSHVDWQTKFISIVDPKGKVSARIPMNELAAAVLSEQDDNHPDSVYFFPGVGNKERTSIKRGVNRIKQRANLPAEFRPLHGLRHHFASMLASSGKVDLYTLQKLLNHQDPRMTQRYAHLVDKALKRGSDTNVELISELISQKKKTDKPEEKKATK